MIFFDILQQIGCEKSPKGTFYIFGTMRQFRNSHFSSEIKIFQYKSNTFFNTANCKFFRYIRTILRFTKAEKIRRRFENKRTHSFGCLGNEI